jgi:hypothetical protein
LREAEGDRDDRKARANSHGRTLLAPADRGKVPR